MKKTMAQRILEGERICSDSALFRDISRDTCVSILVYKGYAPTSSYVMVRKWFKKNDLALDLPVSSQAIIEWLASKKSYPKKSLTHSKVRGITPIPAEKKDIDGVVVKLPTETKAFFVKLAHKKSKTVSELITHLAIKFREDLLAQVFEMADI